MKLLNVTAIIFMLIGFAACQTPSAKATSKITPSSKKQVSNSTVSGIPTGYQLTDKIHHGKASWYSVKTNGGTKTASGEKFTNHGLTAAHKTLPMGTKVRVTNLHNGKKVVVRINDRGPYKKGRIIDLSIGAADHIGMVKRGVVPVHMEVLKKAE